MHSTHYLGTKKTFESQWKKIRVDRVPKRGVSQLMRTYDNALRTAEYDAEYFIENVVGRAIDLGRFLKGLNDFSLALKKALSDHPGKGWTDLEKRFLNGAWLELLAAKEFWEKEEEKFTKIKDTVIPKLTSDFKDYSDRAQKQIDYGNKTMEDYYQKFHAAPSKENVELFIQNIRKYVDDGIKVALVANLKLVAHREEAEGYKASEVSKATKLAELTQAVKQKCASDQAEFAELKLKCKKWLEWAAAELKRIETEPPITAEQKRALQDAVKHGVKIEVARGWMTHGSERAIVEMLTGGGMSAARANEIADVLLP